MFENDEDFDQLGLNLSACEKIKMVNKDMSFGQGLLCTYEFYGSEIVDKSPHQHHKAAYYQRYK